MPEPENQDLGANDGDTSGRLTPIPEGENEDEENEIAAFIQENFGNANVADYAYMEEVYHAVKMEEAGGDQSDTVRVTV